MIADPYKILNIDPSATDEEVKQAYRKLSRKYHPDANVGASNLSQIEEKFKEIQQAYNQIMESREHGYSSTSGYGSYRRTAHNQSSYQYNSEDQTKMQAAANYINNHYFAEALNVLSAVGTRTAEWFYYSALANAGMGNNVNAQNLAEQAVALEPENIEYRQFLQQLQFGGNWYSSMGNTYSSPADGSNICMKLCMINLLCNCCCSRPC